MEKHEISVDWVEGMVFDATGIGGNTVLDADEHVGGQNKGLRPKPLMLKALAGCTGMDVASLMKKMRAEADDFEVKVSGELTDEHPKYYNKVHVIYNFKGKELKRDKLTKCVNLSIDRYCGVFEMFRCFAEVTHEINFIENE